MLLWLVLAGAQEGVLAPTLATWEASVQRGGALLDRAEQAHARLAAAQQAWVAEGCVAARCPVERRAELLVAVEAGGHAARALVQGARAELGRLDRMAAFPAVSALLDATRSQRAQRLHLRADTLAEAVVVRAAWTTRFVLPATRGIPAAALPCSTEPELDPTP
ncbi:MAG: hypothetical protein H6732_17660 [Alphaproteobacteria bacterium]|nr:hypothetical protein [Alphaproteobacteria bacterium]